MDSQDTNITFELYDKSDSKGKELINQFSNMCRETVSKIDKKLNPNIRIKENGEISLFWEFFGNPNSNKLERDYFIENQKIIDAADRLIVALAEFCNENYITYSFKLCKTKKLQSDNRIPTLLTSYISANFPVTEYYISKEHEDLKDATEEFKYRSDNGLYTN